MLSLILTYYIKSLIEKANIYDVPVARSSHIQTTLVGGGLAVNATIVIMLLLCDCFHDFSERYIMITSIVALTVVFFLDDVENVNIALRILIQFTAIFYTTMALTAEGQVVFKGYLPLPIDRALTILMWMWFVNLYNFMDGIDGLTGCQSIYISVMLTLIGYNFGFENNFINLNLLIIGAVAGFLWFNWHPASIFIGDVGSISLGYITGFCLVKLALKGHLLLAFIIPSYYLADSTITLFLRIINREKFWQAHNKHFFQQAVRGGMTHSQTVINIMILNLIIAVLTVSYMYGLISSPLLTLSVGYVTISTLVKFRRSNEQDNIGRSRNSALSK